MLKECLVLQDAAFWQAIASAGDCALDPSLWFANNAEQYRQMAMKPIMAAEIKIIHLLADMSIVQVNLTVNQRAHHQQLWNFGFGSMLILQGPASARSSGVIDDNNEVNNTFGVSA